MVAAEQANPFAAARAERATWPITSTPGARMSSPTKRRSLPPVRRVVTGHDEDGRSVILSDGPAPCRSAPPAMPELVATVLWTTDGTPAPLDGEEDTAPAGRVPPMAPPANGTILRIADFPPDSAYDDVDIAQMFREIGGAAPREAGNESGDPRHFWFHKTPTLDYAIVLEGEIWALLDDGETLMRTGDVLIQRGTNHAWANRSDRPCRMAFVLIDAPGGIVSPPDHHVRADRRLPRQGDARRPARAARRDRRAGHPGVGGRRRGAPRPRARPRRPQHDGQGDLPRDPHAAVRGDRRDRAAHHRRRPRHVPRRAAHHRAAEPRDVLAQHGVRPVLPARARDDARQPAPADRALRPGDARARRQARARGLQPDDARGGRAARRRRAAHAAVQPELRPQHAGPGRGTRHVAEPRRHGAAPARGRELQRHRHRPRAAAAHDDGPGDGAQRARRAGGQHPLQPRRAGPRQRPARRAHGEDRARAAARAGHARRGARDPRHARPGEERAAEAVVDDEAFVVPSPEEAEFATGEFHP